MYFESLLKLPIIIKHYVNLWNVIFKNFNIKFNIHYLVKAKQTCFTFNTKSTLYKNFCFIFWHEMYWLNVLMPMLYNILKELKSYFIWKKCYTSIIIIIIDILLHLFNTFLLINSSKHWGHSWKRFFIIKNI